MKKKMAVLLSAWMAVSLGACGTQGTEEEQT